jgi:hypothetical protein
MLAGGGSNEKFMKYDEYKAASLKTIGSMRALAPIVPIAEQR